MTQSADLIITNTSQVCTVPAIKGKPQRGADLGTLGLIEHGAVAIKEGAILAVGSEDDILAAYSGDVLDAQGMAVVPGFVDPHTHLVWGGDRAAEFEMRLAGATYMEIMGAGGGINSTVRQTRAASAEALADQARDRLDRMFRLGATTIEIKTGYGLDTASELKLLEAIYMLADTHPATIAPTFLGAHAVPPEFEGRTAAYVDLLVKEMIPAAADFTRSKGRPMPFIDVFCEEGVFDVDQSRRILEAGRAQGMPLKIHADEFAGLGGTALAVELGAVSVDHLLETPESDIAALGRGDTIAVSLPATPFGLALPKYTPAKEILNAGGALALATDCNPGTAWCESMQFVMALACRSMKITPPQALAAATINAAFAIGLADSAGSLEVGKQADLLILDVPDYRHLAYRFGGNVVRTVLKRGEILWTTS